MPSTIESSLDDPAAPRTRDWWWLVPIIALPMLLRFALGWTWDDPFITYRYATNLATGHGFVYNPGLRILSTTTPLYALLLSIPARHVSDLSRLSNVIGLLALIAGACVLTTLLPTEIPGPIRGGAGLLLILMTNPLSTLGSEVPLYILLILLAFRSFQTGNSTLAAFLSGLATVARADGVLCGLVIGLNLVRKEERPRLVRAVAAYGIATLPWYLFSWIYYGTPIPATLAAKRHQEHLVGQYGFLRGLLTTLNFERKDLGIFPFLLLAVFIVIGVWVHVSKRRFPPILQWTVLYILGYSVIGVVYYHWYYAPLFAPEVYLAAVALGDYRARIDSADGGAPVEVPVFGARTVRASTIAAGCLALGILIKGAQAAWSFTHQPLPVRQYRLYRPVGDWLASSTPAGSTVGALQIGVIGYYSRRPMIDFAGLTEPDVGLSGGKDYLAWETWAIQHYRPDYVAMDMPYEWPITQQAWFKNTYQSVKKFSTPETKHDQQCVVIYRRD